LYDSAKNFRKPTRAELDRADASFPSTAKLDDLADTMVQIDERFDRLKALRTENWIAPPSQLDIDPPHEALILRELLREAHREGGPATGKPADLLSRLASAEGIAQSLEQALRAKDAASATASAKTLESACAACHDRYRDPARGRITSAAKPQIQP
jgi:hypothetical protein